MEIEVGEYVRTSNGLLGRINKIELKESGTRYAGEFITDTIIQFNDGKVYERRVKDKDIVKHSNNILDLIEKNDIVNGYRVLDIADSIYKNSKRILIHRDVREEKWTYIQEFDGKIHTQDDIKTILTHEQYEQNCYKVKE